MKPKTWEEFYELSNGVAGLVLIDRESYESIQREAGNAKLRRPHEAIVMLPLQDTKYAKRDHPLWMELHEETLVAILSLIDK